MKKPEDILEAYKSGMIGKDEAVRALYESRSTNLLHSRIDHDREYRTGACEVIFGQGKNIAQIVDIMGEMLGYGSDILVTRLSQEQAGGILDAYPAAQYYPEAGLLMLNQAVRGEGKGLVAVVSAGTSDHRIAEEAALTAEFLGSRVERFYDCGVAGLHRLLDVLDDIRQARTIVAVAGMEGALPSVLAGLVKSPVVAVPTSVGYGMNLQGVSTLLAMLNSCANGVSVVNIDNGFGAGYNAHIINTL